MDWECRPILECVACGSSNLIPVLDLNNQPLANSYKLRKEDTQKEYPLAINHCAECFHVQLTHEVNSHLMFDDYLYVSGTSRTMHDHMKNFASEIDSQVKNKVILDIGCNDGTQLDYFKDLGYTTIGIDPAQNLYSESSKRHKIYCDYFNSDFVKNFDKVDLGLIVAQNVFAHNANPLAFLIAAKDIMNDDTVLVIQTSQANMIFNNEFDTIYHEHVSFFNIKSMNELCKRAGLHLLSVEMAPIHGDSYVFTIKKSLSMTEKMISESTIRDSIVFHGVRGLYDNSTYVRYANKCKDIVNKLKYETDFVRQGMIGWNVVGYGAAAKGMTLINYAKLNLDFIIDDNPLKQGRFTPGSGIPIYGPEKLSELTDTTLFVPLAWNYFDEIKEKIKKQRDHQYDRFIKYFPEVVMS